MRLRDVLLALTVAGCGSVSDNGNMPDAPADAPDTAAPMIVDSHPSNNGKAVSVILPITIVLDEAIDPATLTATSIKVRATTKGSLFETFFLGTAANENVFLIQGAATYDAAGHKIVFTPLQPLPFNAHVDVSVDGVKDVAGNVFSTRLGFETLANTDTRAFFFQSFNQLSGFFDFGVGANGIPGRFGVVNGPGTDFVWLTADDIKEEHWDQVYDMGGHFTVLHMFQIGTDNMWGTPDDVESNAQVFTYDMMGRFTSQSQSTAVGPDGAWGSGDDVPASNTVLTWMGDNFISLIQYRNPGLDAVWRTADDQMSSTGSSFFKYQYDTNNQRTRQVFYTPGADKVPGTVDDTTTRYFDITNDTHGFITRNVQRGAGGNGTFFDGDDVNLNYTQTTRDARGLPTEIKFYDTAGTNGTWFDSDDHVTSRQTFTYNMAGQQTEDIRWGSGANGIFGDADDVIGEYYVTSYDAKGARLSQVYYSSPGPDAIFKTSDDQIEYRRLFDPNH